MTDKTFVDPNTDDLDAFNSLLQGTASPPEPEPEPAPEPVDEDDVVVDTPVEHSDSVDTEPKKKTAKDRIDELTAARREAERREQSEREARIALEARLKALEEIKPKEAPKPVIEATAPTADDVNEDGTAKYPLGEFDPNFIRDLTKFTIAEEQSNIAKAREAQAVEAQRKQFINDLSAKWTEKVNNITETIPDFKEKGQNLVSVFNGLDPQYGEFLSTTLMQMEHGPEVLNHLANNIEEATRIVNSGPINAAISLGRLEAQFVQKEKPKARPSAAPQPAPVNRGIAVGGEVPGDTDDLDAFSSAFFAKRR
ncbi:hypothetical protein KGP36_03000 [Patescibacteria group bacterium]|nr:hypothetical protein [Patescibacteria group bacterium]